MSARLLVYMAGFFCKKRWRFSASKRSNRHTLDVTLSRILLRCAIYLTRVQCQVGRALPSIVGATIVTHASYPEDHIPYVVMLLVVSHDWEPLRVRLGAGTFMNRRIRITARVGIVAV